MATLLCNTVWLIIINCFSSLKGKIATTSNNVDGLNQKMAEALTTPGLLSLDDEKRIREELEKIEDAQVAIDQRVLAISDWIQKQAEQFNQKPQKP